MDIAPTTVPDSTQLNFDDVADHSVEITVTEVKRGTKEQPVELVNAEFPGRAYRPGKSMRRVLVAAWGPEASVYVGRRIRLYGDPSIKFGAEAVGGIRIAALSHLEKELVIPLTVTRGRRAPFVVQPLTVDTAVHEAALKKASTIPELQTAWQSVITAGVSGNRQLVALKELRKAELTTTPNQQKGDRS
jgi:hypothetical protein